MDPQKFSSAFGLALAFLLALTVAAAEAGAEPAVGNKAPWFNLKSITGNPVALRDLQGKPAILVVGRTQKAAPPCKAWMQEVLKRFGSRARAYQVIVVDKAWFLPRSAVLKRIKSFVAPQQHHLVLLEWHTVFADTYRIPRHDDPTLVVLDAGGIVRLVHRGPLAQKPLATLEALLRRLAPDRLRAAP